MVRIRTKVARRRIWQSIDSFAVSLVLSTSMLVACAKGTPGLPAPTEALPAAAEVLPVAGAAAGWQRDGQVKTYDHDSLYNFMDGAADLYFTYGFEELAVASYVHAAGGALQVQVYRVATDADAYGLYTYSSYGQPIALGVDGELDSGNRLAFWQARTFVQVLAREAVSDDVLRAMGAAVASALPQGGQRPPLVDHLPKEGLQAGSVRFFRQKMALDNLLWLGTEDVLGLSTDADGVIARYDVSGQPVDLLLIAFPEGSRAQQAQSGLQAAGLEDLIDTAVKGVTLGAVFGAVDATGAAGLLAQAMSTFQ